MSNLSQNIWAIASSFSRFIVQFGVVVVLARIGSTQDFGFAAVITVFLLFGELLGDTGVSQVILQRRHVNPALKYALYSRAIRRGVFWLVTGVASSYVYTVSMGWSQFSVCLFAIPITYFCHCEYSIRRTFMLREGKSAELGLIEFASALVGAVAAIVLGLNNEVLIGLTSFAAVSILCRSLFSPFLIPPKRLPKTRISKSYEAAGRILYPTRILNFINGNIDTFFLSLSASPSQLGIYSQGFRFLQIPIAAIVLPVNKLAIVAFSKEASGKRVSPKLLNAILILLSIPTFSISSFMLFNGQEVIMSLIGPQWIQAAAVFNALAPVLFFAPVSTVVWASLRTASKLKDELYLAATQTSLFLVSVFIGTRFSIETTATSVSMASIAGTTIAGGYLLRKGLVSFAQIKSAVATCSPIGILAVLAGYVSHVSPTGLGSYSLLGRILIFVVLLFLGVLCSQNLRRSIFLECLAPLSPSSFFGQVASFSTSLGRFRLDEQALRSVKKNGRETEVLFAVTTRGGERLNSLRRLFESLKQQSNKNFEVVVSDQSTSLEVIDLIEQFPELCIKRVTGAQGSTEGRNHAFMAARKPSRYIVFPNDSTFYDHSFVNVLRNFGEDLVVFGYFDRADKSLSRYELPEGNQPLSAQNIWRILEAGFALKTERFKEIGGFETNIGAGSRGPWQNGGAAVLANKLRLQETTVRWWSDPPLVFGESQNFLLDKNRRVHKYLNYGRGYIYACHALQFARVRMLASCFGPFLRRSEEVTLLDRLAESFGRIQSFLVCDLVPRV